MASATPLEDRRVADYYVELRSWRNSSEEMRQLNKKRGGRTTYGWKKKAWGGDPNVPNEQGVTRLHFAAIMGYHREVMKYLEVGGNPNVQDKVGNTPFHAAFVNGHHGTAWDLLSVHRLNPNIVNKYGDSPLMLACAKRCIHFINRLLELGADPNVKNNRTHAALHIAACKEDWFEYNATRFELEHSVRYKEAFDQRSYERHFYYNADGNQDHGMAVEALLQSGASVDARDREGNTALHYAVDTGHVPAIFHLLEFGGDPTIPNARDISPLDLAEIAWPEMAAVIRSVFNDGQPCPWHLVDGADGADDGGEDDSGDREEEEEEGGSTHSSRSF